MAENDEHSKHGSDWTLPSYIAHNEAIRTAEEKFQQERDRRYSEVKLAEEKALKVKETADLAALGLARDIQLYKDEKANELREQINRERGLYATKADLNAASDKLEAIIKPLLAYMAGEQGMGTQADKGRARTDWVITLAISMGLTVLGVIVTIILFTIQRATGAK